MSKIMYLKFISCIQINNICKKVYVNLFLPIYNQNILIGWIEIYGLTGELVINFKIKKKCFQSNICFCRINI